MRTVDVPGGARSKESACQCRRCKRQRFNPWVGKIPWSSVQFSRSVVSDSLRPHKSQHARPPCPTPTPGVHSNSRPLSQWCHSAISSSVIPFSSCPQSFPASQYYFFLGFYFLNFKIFNSYMRSQTWTPLPPPSPYQSFSMSQIFVWGGQSAGVSALASFYL